MKLKIIINFKTIIHLWKLSHSHWKMLKTKLWKCLIRIDKCWQLINEKRLIFIYKNFEHFLLLLFFCSQECNSNWLWFSPCSAVFSLIFICIIHEDRTTDWTKEQRRVPMLTACLIVRWGDGVNSPSQPSAKFPEIACKIT